MYSLLAIYPTSHKVEDLLKRQSRVQRILLGHRVTTFPQITDALWREASIPRIPVGPAGEWLALEEAIGRVRTRGVEMPFVPGVGIRDHLLGFIHQLKTATVDASELRRACTGLPETALLRISAIAEIFVEYDRVLREAGAVDAHDQQRLVIEGLHRAEQNGHRPRFLRGVERLLLAEVYDPSLLQFMLVSSMVRLIGDATLTIQAEPFDLRVRRFAELTWNRFVAEESIGDKVLPHFVRRGGRKGRLGFVLGHLFAQKARTMAGQRQMSFAFAECDQDARGTPASRVEVPPQDSTVRIIAAADPRREAEEVARAIRQMLEMPASEQIALDRIAIVARNLAAYGDHLEAAFRAYGIPLKLHQRKPLSAYASARVVQDILRIPLQDYHREGLLSLCRAPFVRFEAARYEELPRHTGYIDQKTRPLARCIESRRAELAQALEQNSDTPHVEMLSRRLRRLERGGQAWCDLIDLLATLEAPGTIAGYVTRTLGVLGRLGFDPVGETSGDSAAAAAGPLSLAFEMLSKEGDTIAPVRTLTLSEFASLIGRVFNETTIESRVDDAAGGVRAMTVADARGLDFEQVFVVGLNDGIFPTYHSEDALVPDHVIRKLNGPLNSAMRRCWGRFAPDAPGPILRTRDDRNLEEPFLFFLAMSMPSRSIVLSYSAADASGDSLPVSPFLDEVRRILNDPTSESSGANEFIPIADDCFARGEFLARAALDSMLSQQCASAFADPVQTESILRRIQAEHRREAYFALPTREELVNQRRRQQSARPGEWLAVDLSSDAEKDARASKYDGRVCPSMALSRFLLNAPNGEPRPWSAAQLTELAACGYKFLARRIMQLQETEDPDYEQTALETGTLVHEILREIFTHAQPADPASLRLSMGQVLDAFHSRHRLAARDPAFFEIEWRSVDSMVNEVIEYEIERLKAGEIPAEMRHEFKFKLSLPVNLSFETSAPEIALVGQIDRLEIYRDSHRIIGIKLIDYKTSRRLSNYAQRLKPGHFACEDLQMPVYALAAVEHFGPELSREAPVEASYVVLKSRDKETEPQMIPQDLLWAGLENDRQKTVANRVRHLIASAAAGRFDVDPLQCSSYCPYRRVCRYRKPVFDS
ncbi:MAG: exodeoxyribonuclease V subunit gamma [Deltaproteobacteria bacterium]|nr:exodeoxyribonuclease V subunit gamma [Deltaproteobacteria bacterium]